MEKYMKFWLLGMILLLAAGMVACNDDDDDDPIPQVQKKVYNLNAVGESGVSGTVTFTRQTDGFTLIEIDLSGTAAGNSHPSHIHANSASEGGGIVIDLMNVDGATGESSTTVTERNDGTEITYEELIAFDGYVNVHLSASELSTLVAQGDIGSNATGTSNNGNGGGVPY
ncbi:CHRD domain-containing protein [Echinicola salinicaeni]|uniref:CHRD domain-containing protein n=1 Tax=Echinicola salinicaeni TaxID=2762757 RepID=UPI0016469AD3|nr:CHRD domain-containing protein [Echinicola salinicaeni]